LCRSMVECDGACRGCAGAWLGFYQRNLPESVVERDGACRGCAGAWLSFYQSKLPESVVFNGLSSTWARGSTAPPASRCTRASVPGCSKRAEQCLARGSCMGCWSNAAAMHGLHGPWLMHCAQGRKRAGPVTGACDAATCHPPRSKSRKGRCHPPAPPWHQGKSRDLQLTQASSHTHTHTHTHTHAHAHTHTHQKVVGAKERRITHARHGHAAGGRCRRRCNHAIYPMAGCCCGGWRCCCCCCCSCCGRCCCRSSCRRGGAVQGHLQRGAHEVGGEHPRVAHVHLG